MQFFKFLHPISMCISDPFADLAEIFASYVCEGLMERRKRQPRVCAYSSTECIWMAVEHSVLLFKLRCRTTHSTIPSRTTYIRLLAVFMQAIDYGMIYQFLDSTLYNMISHELSAKKNNNSPSKLFGIS